MNTARKQDMRKEKAAFGWRLMLAVLLLFGAGRQINAFFPVLTAEQNMICVLYMLMGFLLTIWLYEYRRHTGRQLSAALLLLPLLLVFLILGPQTMLAGGKAFLNRCFSSCNARYDLGLRLFRTAGSEAALLHFGKLFFFMAGGLAGILYHPSLLLNAAVCLLFLLLPLLAGCSLPLPSVLLVTVFLGKWITMDGQFSRRRVGWTLGLLFVFLLCIGQDRRTELNGIRQLRTETEALVRKVRYGKDTLPEGDLRKAAQLKLPIESMLTVTSELAKNLYLRGFVGGRYQEGCWQPLRKADFNTESRAGLLSWLRRQGFSVLKQPAEYWECTEEERPRENRIRIEVDKASRYYTYLPATVSLFNEMQSSRLLDARFMSNELLGTDSYSLREISDSRPSELMVAADWLQQPETAEQQTYCAAEAEYRTAVHELYTEYDGTLKELLNTVFWADYETENDGIYSAVTHVREILRREVSYTDFPEPAPDGEDPIRWMLTEAHEGNAVLFATAAAEALRLHGIPTRYIEGYYVSEQILADSADGSAVLSGKDAHAWLEIYFDGIGWLPVDVTPGYYYDTVKLQALVSAPDAVHKTAAEEPGEEEMDMLGQEAKMSSWQSTLRNLQEALVFTAEMLFGAVILLVLLGMLCLAAAEILRTAILYGDRRRYARMNREEKLRFMMRRIYSLLALHGIPARLGWQREETDRLLCARFPEFEAGDYLRIADIFEKAVYGGVPAEAYELRTVEGFCRQLSLERGRQSVTDMLRVHFGWFRTAAL